MKKKLQLDELKVKSFVTQLLPNGKATVQGGVDGDGVGSDDIYCLSAQICTVVVVPPPPIPTPYTNRGITEVACDG